MSFTQIQLRRGTAAQWLAADTLLAEGEMGVETDSGKFKVGDGVTTWNNLQYSSGPPGEDGQDGLSGSIEVWSGDAEPNPRDEYIIWIDTSQDPVQLKVWNENTEQWELFKSGAVEIYTGTEPPDPRGDYVMWINPDAPQQQIPVLSGAKWGDFISPPRTPIDARYTANLELPVPGDNDEADLVTDLGALADDVDVSVSRLIVPLIEAADLSNPPYSTPYDGQTVDLKGPSNLTWRLRYVEDNGNWAVIGGAPYHYPDTLTRTINTTTWTTVMPDLLTVPVSGVYDITVGGTFSSSTMTAMLSAWSGTSNNVVGQSAQSSGNGNDTESMITRGNLTGGSTIGLAWRLANTGSVTLTGAYLRIEPIVLTP